MKAPAFIWLVMFTKLLLIFAAAFTIGISLLSAIASVINWLTTDVWQLEPLGLWLRSAVKGILLSIMLASALTAYTWFMQTTASTLTKILVAGLVIAALLLIARASHEGVEWFLETVQIVTGWKI
jgi:hypothetical protein